LGSGYKSRYVTHHRADVGPSARRSTRHPRDEAEALVLQQSFVTAEVERPVPGDWTAHREAELVATERRFRRLRRIKKILRIHRVVAQKFENRPLQQIRSGARHRADHGARRPPVLCAVGAGEYLELAHRLDTREAARPGDCPPWSFTSVPSRRKLIWFGRAPATEICVPMPRNSEGATDGTAVTAGESRLIQTSLPGGQ
jgi:hypothetical protein